jgi:hypothetical protein
MTVLICSRIIFTFSDFSDSGKNAIAVVLIVALVLVLLHSVIGLLIRKIRGKQHIVVSPGAFESLTPEERSRVCKTWTEYQILHLKKLMEVDHDYAKLCAASKILMASTQKTAQVSTAQPTVMELPLTDSPVFGHVGIANPEPIDNLTNKS